MKKKWLRRLKLLFTAAIMTSLLLQALPVMAGSGQTHLLRKENDYEALPWSDWTMEGGIYYLVNKKSGLVLDIKGNMDRSEALAAVQLYERTDGDNPSQHFRISGTQNGWYSILPCSNTDLAVNPYSGKPKSGTRINLYERDPDDDTQGWLLHWDEENEGWIIRCAYDETLVLTARGSTNQSRVILRKYKEDNLAQVWEILPYRAGSSEETNTAGVAVNENTCQVVLPADWEGRYFTREVPFSGGLCTEFFSSRCYEAYEGTGLLFSIVTCYEIDYNWPDYFILGNAGDRYVVLMRPTDVQFDMSNVDATNEYLDLSNDIEQIVNDAVCEPSGSEEGQDNAVEAIRPYVYFGSGEEYEAYMGVDQEGRLIEAKDGYIVQDSEAPQFDRGWFYDPDSDIGREKSHILTGMWTVIQDMWTEDSKEAWPSFSISFNEEGRVDVLDGSGEVITGEYLLNVSDADTTVIALADTNEGKYHLIISMYNGVMEIYGLPEITVNNADGSVRRTRTWGFIYDGPFMINDMHGG